MRASDQRPSESWKLFKRAERAFSCSISCYVFSDSAISQLLAAGSVGIDQLTRGGRGVRVQEMAVLCRMPYRQWLGLRGLRWQVRFAALLHARTDAPIFSAVCCGPETQRGSASYDIFMCVPGVQHQSGRAVGHVSFFEIAKLCALHAYTSCPNRTEWSHQ